MIGISSAERENLWVIEPGAATARSVGERGAAEGEALAGGCGSQEAGLPSAPISGAPEAAGAARDRENEFW